MAHQIKQMTGSRDLVHPVQNWPHAALAKAFIRLACSSFYWPLYGMIRRLSLVEAGIANADSLDMKAVRFCSGRLGGSETGGTAARCRG
jgi:hypothetical protein